MQISGEIVKITFRSEETGYTVLDLKCSGGDYTTAVGIFPPINEGNIVELKGKYVTKSKYGEQFSAEFVSISMPTKLDSIKKFLASGLIRGLGKVTAEHIVDEFQNNTLEAMKNPFELRKVQGVSLRKATEFAVQYKELVRVQNTIMYLQGLEITIKMALKIYKAFGEDTIDTVKNNPYCLVEKIRGVGFARADKIALELGIERDSDKRISAGIIYCLKESSDRHGNTYLPENILLENCLSILALSCENPEQKIKDNVEDLIMLGQIKKILLENHNAIMLNKAYMLEKSIAKRIVEVSQMADTGLIADADKEIERFESENGLLLHDGQKQAVKNVIENGVAIVTGGPGTGKTTIIKCILHSFSNLGYKVALCAPTGRAAKRMSEATGEVAKTIHRLLDLDFQAENTNFVYGDKKKLPCDVIIVDEVSMVDEFIFCSLLKAISKGARLVLVGDKDQLPSVGAGNILADLIKCAKFTVSNLTQIYRQSNDSAIIQSAHDINNGHMPDLSNKSKDFFFEERNNSEDIKQTVLSLCEKRLPKYLKCSPQSIQVLSPMKKGLAGVLNLNQELQNKLNPYNDFKNQRQIGENLFRVGDKVMQTVNNYQKEWTLVDFDRNERGIGVFNGDIGYIKKVDYSREEVTIKFEDCRESVYNYSDMEQVVLAYAVTIHKSQGSEFDALVISLDANYVLLTRNLLYTAVTRAKKLVVIVGSKKTMKLMIAKNETSTRYSLLKKLILDEMEKVALFD